jgi:hypothetical protein
MHDRERNGGGGQRNEGVGRGSCGGVPRDLRQRVVGTRRFSSSNQFCTRMSLSSKSGVLWLTDLLPRLRIAG